MKDKDFIRIKSITLRNADCFEDITIPFEKRISVLVGANGTGKTTVLNALTGLIIDRLSIKRFPKKTMMIEELFPLTKSSEEPGDVETSISISFNIKKAKLACSYINKRSSHIFLDSGLYIVRGGLSNVLFEVPIIPISSIRLMSDMKLSGISPLYRDDSATPVSIDFPYSPKEEIFLPEYIDLLMGNTTEFCAGKMKQWIVNQYYIRNEEWAEKERIQFRHFKKNLSGLLPEDRKVELIRVDKNFEPIFRTITGEIPFGAFSSGFQSILSIYWNILYFLQAFYPDSENPFIEPGIAIIDELDAHLHPEWQQVILNGLRNMFPNMQFIVATHSPLVVSGCKPGEAIFLKFDREKKSVVLDESAPANVQGWLADRLLTRAFGLSESRDKQTADEIGKVKKIIVNRYINGISDEDLKLIGNLRKKLDLPATDPDSRFLDEDVINEIMEEMNA